MAIETMRTLEFAFDELAKRHGLIVVRELGGISLRRNALSDSYVVRAQLKPSYRTREAEIDGIELRDVGRLDLAKAIDETLAVLAGHLKTEELLAIVEGDHALLVDIQDETKLLRVEAAALRLLKFVEKAQERMRGKSEP